jgi:hypothetical protein
MTNEETLRKIEELARQLLNPDVSAIEVKVYRRSAQAWSVSVEYVGCAGLSSVLRTTRCRGKQPTKAIDAMCQMLTGWAMARG